jgi:hypothetical protein
MKKLRERNQERDVVVGSPKISIGLQELQASPCFRSGKRGGKEMRRGGDAHN